MCILSIKSEILLPERELIINKELVIRQRPAIIASITEQNNIIKLWVFQEMPDSPLTNFDKAEFTECVTHRDEIWRRVSYAGAGCGFISEISIQGVSLPISQLTHNVLGHNPMTHMKLQHFIEAGVDFSSMENIEFNRLALGEYQLPEGADFPEIDTEADMQVSLKIRSEATEELLETSHWFKLEMGEQEISRSFHDPIQGTEITYYINRIVCHDIWKETEERFNNEETLKTLREQGLDDAAIEEARKTIPETLKQVCPKGHVMLLLQYECTDDIQLNFYTTEYLLEKPERAKNSAVVVMISSDDEESRHGYKARSCLLKTVPMGFDGSIEAELISWYRNIPEEILEA